MNTNWIIALPNGSQDVVQCDAVGVSQDGTLLCFIGGREQATAIKGFAPGQWLTFHRSTLQAN